MDGPPSRAGATARLAGADGTGVAVETAAARTPNHPFRVARPRLLAVLGDMVGELAVGPLTHTAETR